MRVENDAVIVLTGEHLVAPLDAEGEITGVARALRELADANLLVVERRGEARIMLGDVLADALERRGG